MNTQKIAVITDSCADVPPELAKELDIYVIPLQIVYSDRTYQAGVDISAQEVYDRLSTEIPKTSLPSGEMILNTFEQIKNAGFEKAIAVMLSSGLSGTCNLVRRLGEEFEELEIVTFDTLSGSLGSGGIAMRLAEYIR
ncbi:MAG: DegV family EDD domain-containing protein, partial [Oscillospiraceae bacterium]|nr:DegV family EDD domain-containing protein [Oscillospiraceae bacterium]